MVSYQTKSKVTQSQDISSQEHIMFNREYVGHLEPAREDIDEEMNLHFQANPDAHATNSITTQRMMAEQVEPDAFEPPHHKLKPSIEAKL